MSLMPLSLTTLSAGLRSNGLAEQLGLTSSTEFEQTRPAATAHADDRVLIARIDGIDCELRGVIDIGNSKAVSLCWE
jgi:hypothetical protein